MQIHVQRLVDISIRCRIAHSYISLSITHHMSWRLRCSKLPYKIRDAHCLLEERLNVDASEHHLHVHIHLIG